MNAKSLLLTASFIPLAYQAKAAPFETCPAQAFLVQNSVAELYGVNLVTGYYQTLSASMNTTGKLNAMGFNYHDDHLYAWSYEYQTLARIGSDYQVEPLPLTGSQPNTSFYVGDSAISENAHFLYRKGSSYGLYRIVLDPSDSNYLQWQQIIDGSQLNLNIFDFAFHPDNEQLYSVDSQGRLWQIDAATGAATSLGNVGQSGTFGAVYFDVEGNLYISRNNDGHIYRLNPTAETPTAEFFAFGPSSSNNDGARCALAPIIDPDSAQVDFGDAPDSYQTALNNNGARHQLGVNSLRLGSKVDGEADAATSPNSDDLTAPADDEDGVYFVTSIQAGLDFIVSVQASEAGVLSAWVDFNQNQSFDADEQILTDQSVVAGENQFLIAAPATAVEGESWSRFRLSSQTGLNAYGGAADGEVEDHPVYIAAEGTQVSFYPALGEQATVAFEDNWPFAGDYDLNDLVLKLHSRLVSFSSGEAGRIEISGEISAMGASYRNSVGIRLPGVLRNQIDEALIRYELNGVLQENSTLEAASNEAIFILTENAKDLAPTGSGCEFFRTEVGCHGQQGIPFKLYIPFVEGVSASTLPPAPYDPFIFAGNTARPPLQSADQPRTLEIHLKNQTPTEQMHAGFWGMGDDRSTPEQSYYFQTANGMPWAVLIPYNWQHPYERIDVSQAYPKFMDYVSSNGEQAGDWYLLQHAKAELIYQD